MTDGFNIKNILYENRNKQSMSYSDVLERIKIYISEKHSGDLADFIDDRNSENMVKDLIEKFIFENGVTVYQEEDYKKLIEKLYNDMAGFAFLTKYIYDESIEEINGNSWEDIEIVYSDGYIKSEEKFASPKHCLDIVRKMVKSGGAVIDGTQPVVDSYINKGLRISAIIPPVVDEECGAVFSIRRQKSLVFTTEQFIKTETASKEELEFLIFCITHGVSVAIAGATGSGKTTDIGYLLEQIPNSFRIYSIEDSRELKLTKRGSNKNILNRAVQTKSTDRVTPDDLLKTALRFDPDIIVPAEMRGKEAMTAQEAGRTGHVILTSLHASTAFSAYGRILTMCMQSGTSLSENVLMKLIIEAFPIMVFKKQLADKSRKYMKIIEAEDYKDGKIIGRTLYRFVVTGKSNRGGLKIEGFHRRENDISQKLSEKFLENGADAEEIRKYSGGEWDIVCEK